ncbi:NAD-dependent epimerase/dehydratase family protein [Flagellimonas sp. DF-77]|uniref:NAD-dependent epimerase/dehydratase family protein n=1 Tax=Flagellimonas algarum TaxID=3230298 RepID=UPI00339B60AD
MVLITGGTGLVGSHLLYKLAQQGEPLRATYRTEQRKAMVEEVFSYYTDDPKALFDRIEWVACDITDPVTLASHFEGVAKVYHCAALISFDPKDDKRLHKINVGGTKNVVNLCIAHGIEKLCYVSSIAAIGPAVGEAWVTEETEWQDLPNTGYSHSKYRSEMEVWRASQEGVDVVIVNPGVIIGPGFFKSGSGLFFHSVARGQKFVLPNGTGFVTVMDTVLAMQLLMGSDLKNERYVLVNENLSYLELVTQIASAMNLEPPKKVLKSWQLELLWRLDWLKSVLGGKRRRLSKRTARLFAKRDYYDHSKIKALEGFSFEPLSAVIAKTAAIYRDHYPE